ncbi:unnamed protein product [Peniophora sp. CBMAI 1063]|nr:unnamed protein product [Peniophora sp. CBMAI 1063]
MLSRVSDTAIVAPVPARAPGLVHPGFMPLDDNNVFNPEGYDDDPRTNLHPVRPPSPIPGSASDHFHPIPSSSSSSPIIHHPSLSTLAPLVRAVPYPARTPRMSHTVISPRKRHRASSTSHAAKSCPTPSSPRVAYAMRPSTSSSSPGVPSPAYPAGFYPTPLPSPPRQRVAPTVLSARWSPPPADTPEKMDIEQNEDVVGDRARAEDERITWELPPHLGRSEIGRDQPPLAPASDLGGLPSFHDLLESLQEPDTSSTAAPDCRQDGVVEQEIERTLSPMRLIFTPVSNSTMASAMEGLDVERLAGEVNSVMDSRSW